jgi:hypothetical protein
MRGHIGLAFFLLISFVFIIFIPDIIVFSAQNNKVNQVVEKITKEAEMQGGVNNEVQQYSQRLLEDYNIQDKGYEISYSSTEPLQQGQQFTVKMEGEYKFKAINLLGTGIGGFTLNISSEDSGRSEVWYR